MVTDRTLHVVAVVSNPCLFQTRYRLFREFTSRMLITPNVKFHVVELAHGDGYFEVSLKHFDLQLRTNHSYWHKEALINLGVEKLLPKDWQYMAWVDGDVSFNRPDWALKTVEALQHHDLVQPWSECAFQGPQAETFELFTSFASLAAKGASTDGLRRGHTGFAWACTRRFWDATQGLMTFSPLGAADVAMAWASVGHVEEALHKVTNESYKAQCQAWQENATAVTKGFLGYVPGTLTHYWHGSLANRRYMDRWALLDAHGFDPATDLGLEENGLPYIKDKPALEEAIYQFMAARNEDGTDLGLIITKDPKGLVFG